ncbi:MAG: FadR family transcriptional regulator [Porphyrobacter sp.]|nr:FadR family transcriptional regulator [Porphyrobacter sp.]
MVDGATPQARLYVVIAGKLMGDLSAGKYPLGAKLPAERELAIMYEVSRPVIREAIIALEVRGLVDVKVGSGVYVRALPDQAQEASYNVSAIEITEARLLIEAEAAALAATQITDAELNRLDELVERIEAENQDPRGTEKADRAFHLAIASASRNNALLQAVERLWQLRSVSPEAALLHEKARSANIKPVVDEHAAIVAALKQRDPAAARAAMRAHLSQVLDSLLFATEERAIAEARRSVQANRDRFSRVTA